jgi:hypothetical protein
MCKCNVLTISFLDHRLPSGKHTKNYGKSQFLMGQLTINGRFRYVSLPEGTHGLENDSTCSRMWFQQSPPPKVPTSSLPAEGLHKPWHRSDARGAPFPALNGIPFGNLTYEKWGFSWIFHICVGLPEGTQVPKKIHVSLQTAVLGMVIYWLPCHEQNVIPSSQYETSPLYDMIPNNYMASSSISTMVSWGPQLQARGARCSFFQLEAFHGIPWC